MSLRFSQRDGTTMRLRVTLDTFDGAKLGLLKLALLSINPERLRAYDRRVEGLIPLTRSPAR